MASYLKHFLTVAKHRRLVFSHCRRAGIPLQGLLHDLSKYSFAEFIPGGKYYTGTKSPNEGERRDIGYSLAWMHHKGRNRHHFEYWTDYLPGQGLVPVPMPVKYTVEMFCDRVAASKVYMQERYTDSSPLEYYEARRDKRRIHEDTALMLEKLLVMLKEKGEDETFSYIRHEIIKKRPDKKERRSV